MSVHSFPGTRAKDWFGPLAANSTATDYESMAPTTTEPASTTDTLWVPVGDRSNADIVVFGTNAADETINTRIIGASQIGSDDTAPTYVKQTLAIAQWTLGTLTGAAGLGIDENQFLADTVTLSVEPGGLQTTSDAANGVAHIMLDCAGCEWIGVQFDMGTSASANAIVGII